MNIDKAAEYIADRLKVNWEYMTALPTANPVLIADVRRAGRRAGRLIGQSVRTAEVARDDDTTLVFVYVRDDPEGEVAERLHERARVAIDRMWTALEPTCD